MKEHDTKGGEGRRGREMRKTGTDKERREREET
jgi:hypothetical protein